ncbi:hypothetical protein AB0M22_32705 [Nocardia sp. NPDC051756]|uniref:hypothetical protein n=1 Tax=Nocardia sp. NPDC051756 TaxID=3154751 RepID=UPI00343FAD88
MAEVFNSLVQRQRPLSFVLRRRTEESGLLGRLARITSLSDLEKFEADLAGALEALRPTPPTLGAARTASRGARRWRRVDEHNGVEVIRHYIAVQADGDLDLVATWPDRADDDLEPVDASARAEYDACEKPGLAELERLRIAEETWALGTPDPPTDAEVTWALYTFVELSRDEERAISAGEREIQSIFTERIRLANQILERIGTQLADYFDTELPQWFTELIADRRDELTAREGVTATLAFPSSWPMPIPKLVTGQPPGGTEPAIGEEPLAEGTNVGFAHRSRLDEATFADVQRVIRLWANSVERYPATFSKIGEDPLSDVLTAALNSSLPGAQREVYSRTGKSDIFIYANTLDAGSGPERVFICEAKIAKDDGTVTRALDPQLFSYLNTHDTAAVLLLFVKQKKFDAAVRERLAALRTVAGFIREEPGPSGWPIFEYEVDGRAVHVCIATVHTPPGKADQ